MALINFNSSVCNYTTSAKVISAAPGSVATNTYEYIDLEMVPDSGYYLDVSNFTYLSNDYVDYVTFMADGDNLKARVYFKSFTWPSERTDLEVPISGCATPVIPTTTTTTTIAATTTTTTTIACPAISGYFINKSIIELRGETRIFKVYGQQGAEFSYTIVDNDNSFTLDTGTKTIPYAGFVSIEVIVPLNATARVFDVTLTTVEACTLQLQTQPATFKLYQGIDEEWVGDTFECCETAGTLLSTNCVGYDLYGTYTDGQCGTTNSLIETNSASCGYVPPTTGTTTTTTVACTNCAGDINAIGDFSAAVGGASGSISLTGTNVASNWSVYTWHPGLVNVSISGSTLNWSTNSSNACGTAQVRVFVDNSAGGNCCTETEDFFITVTGCTGPTTTLATFDCSDAGFSVANGPVGTTVSASVASGTLNSVSPSTYQSGTTVYTANITVPPGYSNSGSTLTTCTDTATGTTTTTTTTTAAPGPSSFTIYANSSSGTNPLQGWATASQACSGTPVPVTVYNSYGDTSVQQSYNNGHALYIDSGLTTVYNGGNTYFKDAYSGGNSFQLGPGGFIFTFSAC